MYAVTGASGQLGRLVIDALIQKVAPGAVVALVRDPAKAADAAGKGVQVRRFDYSRPDTLAPALAGVERLLLISSSEVGQRAAQHQAVIDAAKAAGVKFIAYTSILHADTNPLDLAVEHRATEEALKASGIPHAVLRNGWYTENFTAGAAPAIAHGVLLGSAGSGRTSAAARADYAAAAVAVLAGTSVATQVYELAGDEAFTQDELAAALAEFSGKPVVYRDLPEAEYGAALEQAGLPGPFAHILADSSAKTAGGALFDDSHALSRLIGRPTTPWRQTVKEAVGA
ncbi:SDR family oxidoreductase [Starkeya sp. 3C]|uniref:SDR family oxidoreductase n=1 Tax=Ancylobacter moscoviensis TaxID=2597768 RepID=A0ABY3DUE5_9HYPH|nr:SDR family oxidoreductase [Ancylobacter moscoviensis]TSJ64062.1 SDR family oxidoreductase [Ancylobacter moscoviensis]